MIVYYDASVVLDNSMRMEISSRWKLRLMSAQVVSCCVKKLENYAAASSYVHNLLYTFLSFFKSGGGGDKSKIPILSRKLTREK